MLLESYKNSNLLFNTNFLSPTKEKGLFAYRGELILVEGEVGDEKGHAKPPIDVLRGAVVLADEKIQMLLGALDQMSSLIILIEKYKRDFSEDMQPMLFVVNLAAPYQVEIEGLNFILIPMVQGVPWNETMEELAIEKSDLKGHSAADKLLIIQEELKHFSPNYEKVSLDHALNSITEAVREGWGAV